MNTRPETQTDHDVAVGDEGWMFLVGGSNSALRFYTDPSYFNDDYVQQWRNLLNRRRAIFERSSIRYLHLIAPEKLSVFPSRYLGPLPSFDLHPIRRLRNGIGLELANSYLPDLTPILADETGPYPTYFKTDSHWTVWGAIGVFKLSCATMGFEIEEDFSQRTFARWTETFDLGGKFYPPVQEEHLWIPFADQVFRIYENDIILRQEEKIPVGESGVTHHKSHAIFKNTKAKFDEVVVIFGDSFSGFQPATLTALFTEFFNEVHFYWSGDIDFEYCKRVAATVVITEIAERFVRVVPEDNLTIPYDSRLESVLLPLQKVNKEIVLDAIIPAKERTNSTSVFTQLARPNRPSPIAIYNGQDMGQLISGMDRFSTEPVHDFRNFPAIDMSLHELRDAYFVIENGVDNVIVTRDMETISESIWFASRERDGDGRLILSLPFTELDDVFLGFDAAWHNYYHFLVLGLNRSYLADRVLPNKTQIVIPDYESRAQYSQIAYSQNTYDQALELSGLARRVTKLPLGLYRAKTLRFFGLDRLEPTLLSYLNVADDMFLKIRWSLPRVGKFPTRILISRENGKQPRMSAEEAEIVGQVAAKYGFEKVYLENYDLFDQAAMFYGADAVAAPHGAGLANIFFGSDRLRVLELNRDLDGHGQLRSCFFQAASLRGQKYSFLNQSQGDFTEENFDCAFRMLVE